MSEVENELDGYPSFDAFFTRKLRGGARCVSGAPIVSPADGRLIDAGVVGARSEVLVKGKRYDIPELIGDGEEARAFAGGAFAVVYLSPRDYHRVHSPVDGELYRVLGIPGDLYPVNAIGERHVPNLFAKNQRVAMFVKTGSESRAAVVMVGAMIVGKISVRALRSEETPLGERRLDPPVALRRGDEMGTFHLGSTVVVLLSPGATLARRPGAIRYGESLISP